MHLKELWNSLNNVEEWSLMVLIEFVVLQKICSGSHVEYKVQYLPSEPKNAIFLNKE